MKWTHKDGERTEQAAFEKISPHMAPIKEKILAALSESGDEGLTPDEFADTYDLLINTVRRRFTDLWKEGKIRKTGEARVNSNGNDAIVWVLGEDPLAANSRRNLTTYITRLEGLLKWRVYVTEKNISEGKNVSPEVRQWVDRVNATLENGVK
jgi:hypothetical protein